MPQFESRKILMDECESKFYFAAVCGSQGGAGTFASGIGTAEPARGWISRSEKLVSLGITASSNGTEHTGAAICCGPINSRGCMGFIVSTVFLAATWPVTGNFFPHDPDASGP